MILWGEWIVDGHNRYAIAKKHGLNYHIECMDFADKYEVIDWIIKNQLGRRNVTEEQKSYLRGIQSNNQKVKHGGNRGNQHTNLARSHNDSLPQRTREKLAKEHNVNPKTIERDEQFATGLDVIAEVAPEIKAEVLRSESDLTKQQVSEFAQIEKEKQAAIEKAEYEAEARRQAEHDLFVAQEEKVENETRPIALGYYFSSLE